MVEEHEEKSERKRLDCIYDYEHLGFEKDPLDSTKRMQAQDPPEEIDLGDGIVKRPTYISAKINSSSKIPIVEFLKELKDCFAWKYDEMTCLSRDLVELKLPI